MNIFVLDHDVKRCAQAHNDKHVVKMILETAQLLSTVQWQSGREAPYKQTHVNHPCSVWARESLGNYMWLCELGLELCKEYTHRYGKVHKSEAIIRYLAEAPPSLSNKGMTPFAQAMPEECKANDAVTAYRNYYIQEKGGMAKWSKRERPYWYK
jgi:hypothetical protein